MRSSTLFCSLLAGVFSFSGTTVLASTSRARTSSTHSLKDLPSYNSPFLVNRDPTPTNITAFQLPNITPDAKAVFAHYLVGGLTSEHAKIDIETAKRIGLDAFVLNVGDPTQDWVKTTLAYLFKWAEKLGFKLLISMDLNASGSACWQFCTSCGGLDDFTWMIEKYSQSPAYYKVQGYPMITTFSSGGFEFKHFHAWQAKLTKVPYFVPDIDETQGYYEAADGWWNYWGDAVNGVMSWESTWPKRGELGDGNVDLDNLVIGGTSKRNKSYMIGLSPLQYKNAYRGAYYRRGGNALSQRMDDILKMKVQPNFVQYLTWNDMPESHYIGDIWPESNSDYMPSLYAGPDFSHTGWQSLLSSFIIAFKNNATTMSPVGSDVATGAIWYKTILQSANCSSPKTLPVLPQPKGCHDIGPEDVAQYFKKPDGWNTGDDNMHWAITVPEASQGWTAHVISGHKAISTIPLKPGFNFGSSGPVRLGAQKLYIKNDKGRIVMHAAGVKNVSSICENHIYNMNFQVAGLRTAGHAQF